MSFGEYLGAGSGTTKLLLPLNGNSNDFSGNNNNGVDTAITYSKANGRFNEGAGFNGATSVIQTPFVSLATGTLSISFKLNSNKNHQLFVVNQNSNGSNNYLQFGVWSDGAIFAYTALNYQNFYQSANGIVSLNQTHNVTFTQSGNLLSVYFNGKLIGTKVWSYWFSSIPMANQFCVGALKRGTQIYDPTNGSIDEVIVENKGWTPQEVQKYYTNSLGRF